MEGFDWLVGFLYSNRTSIFLEKGEYLADKGNAVWR